jgi:hypothetical protein
MVTLAVAVVLAAALVGLAWQQEGAGASLALAGLLGALAWRQVRIGRATEVVAMHRI